MSTKRGTLGDRMTQPDPVDAVLNAALDDDGDLGPAPRSTPAPAPTPKPQFAVMNIRMPPELHRALRLISLDRGESVNSMLVKAAEKIVARNKPVL